MDDLDLMIEVLDKLGAGRRCSSCDDVLQPGEAEPCDDCWPTEVPR